MVSLRVRQFALGLSFLCTLAILIQQELVQNIQLLQVNLTRYQSSDIGVLTFNTTTRPTGDFKTNNETNTVSVTIVPNSSAVILQDNQLTNTLLQGKQRNQELPFYKISERGDVFTISIIAANVTGKNHWDTMVANAWEAYKHKIRRFKCCYLWDNGKVTAAVARKTYYRQSTHLRALQYRCSFGGDRDHLKNVAIEFVSLRCSKENPKFQVPYFPSTQPKDSIALCAKIVYGNFSGKLLIDWLEYYREMRVSKIVMFTYNITDITQEILSYYEEIGFLEIRAFDFPWKVAGFDRDVGDKNAQAWQDEQVTVFDCQERLRGYSFVSVVDLDEFLLPLRDENLKEMMRTLLSRHPTAAGFTFMSYLYIKDWGRVEKNNGSDIVQYFNRTYAIYTRQKNIFIPARVEPGSISTHELRPKDGFTRVRVPESLAVINHYRDCYKNLHRVCNRVKRVTDYSILRIYNKIKDNANTIKEMFAIT